MCPQVDHAEFALIVLMIREKQLRSDVCITDMTRKEPTVGAVYLFSLLIKGDIYSKT